MSRPVLVVNARLLDPASGLDRRGGLLVVGGRIAELGPQVTVALAPPGTEVVDARGLCLAPGLVDLRAGFGEPGAEHKERFESGCMAAVAGGVTSLALLPDTAPPIDDPAMVEFVARRARQVKLAKVYPQAAVTRGLQGAELAELGLLKAAGAVAFTDGFKAVADARVMRRALAYASMFDGLLVQHPEEPRLAEGGVMNEGAVASRLGLPGIPAAAEVIMVERDLRLLELAGGRLHFAHVSTAAAVAAIRAAKARGLPVTCDVTPHHLLLTEAEVEGYRTFAKVSPPLRGEADRAAVVEGLVDGTIDAIASDHCPQDQDSKRLPFAQAAFGVIGLQTLLPAALALVHEGRIGLLELLRRLTVAPAAILGIEAGRLAKGAPADFVLFDPDARWTVTEKSLFSLAKNTPFEGRTFRGKVVRTFVDGRTVYEAET
ncbi:MAG: dihydroorotase [Geminicoccaceae bacterium]|nr:dihydroorotase [Geminicoccaceae bacterium]MCX7630518.1 dihydroorotase [Geminicoccaceae bacterium]MDW8123800.1 dihydroorotase [Geminicoccaceae bacterium]